jgi:type IV pilus assembly protein PilA
MVSTSHNRIGNERKGLTLIEFLVVAIILGIVAAIAIPSYLSFRARADRNANKASVRSIIPAIEAYHAEKKSYSGMTLTVLQTKYDQALDPSKYALEAVTGTGYCVQSPRGDDSNAYRKAGPEAGVVRGRC